MFELVRAHFPVLGDKERHLSKYENAAEAAPIKLRENLTQNIGSNHILEG